MPSFGRTAVTRGAVDQLVVAPRRILSLFVTGRAIIPVSPVHGSQVVPRHDQLSSGLPILLGPSVQASEHVLIDIAARVRAWRGPWRWVVHQAAQRHDTAPLLPRLRRVRTLSALARSRGPVWRWVLVLRRSATGCRGCGRAPSRVRFTVDVRRGQALPVFFFVQPSLWNSAPVFWRRRVVRASGRGQSVIFRRRIRLLRATSGWLRRPSRLSWWSSSLRQRLSKGAEQRCPRGYTAGYG